MANYQSRIADTKNSNYMIRGLLYTLVVVIRRRLKYPNSIFYYSSPAFSSPSNFIPHRSAIFLVQHSKPCYMVRHFPVPHFLVLRVQRLNNYDASELLAMQTAVIARAVCLSVRLSVCLSVTFRCFVQTNEDTMARSKASGCTIVLVLGEVKFIRIFAGDHH